MDTELSFVGVGGHFETVIDSCSSHVEGLEEWNLSLFDDCKKSVVVRGVKIKCRPLTDVPDRVERLHIAIGDNLGRKELYERFSSKTTAFLSVVDETAILSPSVTMGNMVVLAKGTIIEPKVSIGNGVIVNTGAVVCHGCEIGSFCHLAPNSTVCGDCVVGASTLIGAGAIVLPGVTIGSNCVIGAGALVTKNVPDNLVLYSKSVCEVRPHVLGVKHVDSKL